MKKHTRLTVATLVSAIAFAVPASAADPASSFTDLVRPPDAVTVVTETETLNLTPAADTFAANGIEIKTTRAKRKLAVTLAAPKAAVKRVQLTWNCTPPTDGWTYLGDTWERGYGNLEWQPLSAKRVMPWYFLASNGTLTHGYGVMVRPAACCAWRVATNSITLDLDVRNGGTGVLLGDRTLDVCTVVTRQGKSGKSAFAATRAFCRDMCPVSRLPKEPVYGFNDWYCDYGKNSAVSIRDYAATVVRLAPKGGVRPFMVIDDGWQTGANCSGTGGPWDCGNDKFPSMSGIAAEIKKAGAKPGIWIRLLTAQHQPAAWRCAYDPNYLDPSIPDVRDYVKERIARLRGWGFQLIKHDFSTMDITGLWRSASASEKATWHFADRSRTTAEIIRDFYQAIRDAAGDDTLVMGCQTVSHLAAGLFELSRIGDDTSGKDWSRTRMMGVNSLAFRAPQHGLFYSADADCVGLTVAEMIPWKYNRQWLDLVARSGTPLFISFKKGALTPEQEKEVAAALAIAATPQPLAEPLDWQSTLRPVQWKLMGKINTFDWGK